MANPPFNADEVDADKIKSDVDRRLPFGLPGDAETAKRAVFDNGEAVDHTE